MRMVIALGGNALRRKGGGFDYEVHYENAHMTFEKLADAGFFSENSEVVLTHGNGPQVGLEFMRHFITKDRYPIYPLYALTASTQGWVGFILEQALRRVLKEKKIDREVATVLTLVEVSPDDPALKDPQKPIGEFLTREEALELSIRTNMPAKEDSSRGWRLVVGSPKPLRVINSKVIERLVGDGVVVIGVGGGGIPVDGSLKGVPAVIDKDRASSLLASEIDAQELWILTSVPYVYINYAKPNQRPLKLVRVEEMEKLMGEGHFAPGSMLPKVEAAVDFIKKGGKKVVITSADYLSDTLRGEAGTVITP